MKPEEPQKPPMTAGQKRLLALVYAMGFVLVALFIFVLGNIAWQFAHLK